MLSLNEGLHFSAKQLPVLGQGVPGLLVTSMKGFTFQRSNDRVVVGSNRVMRASMKGFAFQRSNRENVFRSL